MRRLVGVAVAVVLVAALPACSGDDHDESNERDPAIVKTDAAWESRQLEYLEHATQTFEPGNPLNVLAHFERAQRDANFKFDGSQIPLDAFDPIFSDIDGFEDTTDFDVLYLMNLWAAYGGRVPNELGEKMIARFQSFKYWYTEPTPEGVVDNKYYWSENHRIIFHVDEYLAGTAFPNATFGNDRRPGSQHAATARKRILDWLDEKVRFGFSEWHSNVYYQKDVTPLLTLIEFTPDADLANRASMVLDLFLLDLALHLQRGTFGATHGRSYMKDKSTALDEDTFGLAKLLFDDTSEPYQPGTDPGAVLFARARKYEVPQVIRDIARSDEPMTDLEHMNVPLDINAPVTPNPTPPYGISFTEPANVPFWWERGAQTAWQTVETTIDTLNEHDLWDSQFYAPFKPLADAVGGDMDQARTLAQSLNAVLGFGLLSEVHTYTYRARDVMLSTAQDYRPGVFADQIQAWQATLDEHALVFTTHPKNEPEQGTEWPDSDGYWTGSGSIPRSAQQGAVSINIYAPQFEVLDPPLDQFGYLDYTHAYFPQEKFDEVVSEGNWTFGRKGDGYVALWSQHTPEWREHNANVVFTHGLTKPFDLVADSAENVWIAEVGDAAKWETFEAFRAAITAAPVAVQGNAVTYKSPTEGELRFSWTDPLTVNGQPIELHTDERMKNPFVTVPFEGRNYDVRLGDASLVLDFNAWTRTASS
jgi:hypothetical protein